ncbi:MAG: Ribosomal protein S2, small subunit ribosomal protein S2 [Candidatus Gottesmanbacteria bacterium GW2011_GWA2_43_14]|uniref:Small ribosomal subunit protein uS2 n=1 Tax=Candidatus Gottesmanbacteria bacterium GW2011_GWA2_43_14 TaxID=1618443 RepID=A0A0G1DIU8_9BACT|nr:MAG: Ribosomal protein S2, small subunit ribosomal protein S2 [Candidatus Gottesmanbacteria bacterium GW2011_GWA2_43_14]
MKEISLTELLEAGCHFGHKVTRWHPKASVFIYQPREGVHIIDLVKTKQGLQKAAEFVYELGKSGKILLLVGSKRQAKGVVSEAAKRVGLPFMTNRWIGGFITNWEEVKKNIDKMNNWRKDRDSKVWDQYPKHEVVKLGKLLRQVESVYSGVESLTRVPDAVFIVDINKEVAALREATRRKVDVVAIVDTNANPTLVDYPVPANDDAVGSIQFLVNYLVEAYDEGRKLSQKAEAKKAGVKEPEKELNAEEKKAVVEEVKPKEDIKAKPEKKELKKEPPAKIKKAKKPVKKAAVKKGAK